MFYVTILMYKLRLFHMLLRKRLRKNYVKSSVVKMGVLRETLGV